MDYESLLERAEDKIERSTERKERFEVLEADIINQGNSTILNNFSDLVKSMRRETGHFMKFLLREMAVPGERQAGKLVLQGRFSKEQIDKKIELYMTQFVICASCGKPDTSLVNEGGLVKMACEACKARRTVRSIK